MHYFLKILLLDKRMPNKRAKLDLMHFIAWLQDHRFSHVSKNIAQMTRVLRYMVDKYSWTLIVLTVTSSLPLFPIAKALSCFDDVTWRLKLLNETEVQSSNMKARIPRASPHAQINQSIISWSAPSASSLLTFGSGMRGSVSYESTIFL